MTSTSLRCALLTARPSLLSNTPKHATPCLPSPSLPRPLDPFQGGQYFADLNEAGAAALAFYRTQYFPRANASQVLVFDIDETTLSNLAYDRSTGFGATETAESWDSWVQAASAPAIKAVRAVYLEAYAANMSVTFLTGRFEGGRNATVNNLRLAGYGSQCASDAQGTMLRGSEPCYLRLDMRSSGAEHGWCLVHHCRGCVLTL